MMAYQDVLNSIRNNLTRAYNSLTNKGYGTGVSANKNFQNFTNYITLNSTTGYMMFNTVSAMQNISAQNGTIGVVYNASNNYLQGIYEYGYMGSSSWAPVYTTLATPNYLVWEDTYFGGDGGIALASTGTMQSLSSVPNRTVYEAKRNIYLNLSSLRCSGADFTYACENYTEDSIPSINCSYATNVAYMFNNSINLVNAYNLGGFENITNMSRMFRNCTNLTYGLRYSYAGKVTDTSYMYYNCTNLRYVEDFTNVNLTNIYGMFTNCNRINASGYERIISCIPNYSNLSYAPTTNIASLLGFNYTNFVAALNSTMNATITSKGYTK